MGPESARESEPVASSVAGPFSQLLLPLVLALRRAMMKLFLYRYLRPNTNSKMWTAPQGVGVLKWFSFCHRGLLKRKTKTIPYTSKGKAEDSILSFCYQGLPYDRQIQGHADKFLHIAVESLSLEIHQLVSKQEKLWHSDTP